MWTHYRQTVILCEPHDKVKEGSSQIPLKEYQHLHWTLCGTDSAVHTFGIVYHRDAIDHFDTMLGAIFDTDLTLNASGLAIPGYLSLKHIQIRADGYGPIQVPGDYSDDMLGTFDTAGFASCTFFIIDFWEAVITHRQGVKLAYFYTVAKTLTAPGTGFDAARGHYRSSAAFYPNVFAS